MSKKNLKVVPSNDASAASRKYIDSKTNAKTNKNDLNDYLKLDGSSQMQGDLQMNFKRITNLAITPTSLNEAVNKGYVDDNIKKVILNHRIL